MLNTYTHIIVTLAMFLCLIDAVLKSHKANILVSQKIQCRVEIYVKLFIQCYNCCYEIVYVLRIEGTISYLFFSIVYIYPRMKIKFKLSFES